MDWANDTKLNEYLPKLSWLQEKRIRNGAKIKVCEEQWLGWTGKLPFYIFWCSDCDGFGYDYPHGHIEAQYLNCHRCDTRIDFVPWWVALQQLWYVAKYMFRGGAR